MDIAMPDLHFKLMSLLFKIRDLLVPRRTILKEAGLLPGFQVLDYGCGPGSYTIAAAQMVGSSGTVSALDIHPLAIESVNDAALKKNLTNIQAIRSDCNTSLPDKSIDVVLFYDILHDLSEPTKVLEELHRVRKPEGRLSFSDHHMKEHEIILRMTSSKLFRLRGRGKRTFTFEKARCEELSNCSRRSSSNRLGEKY